MDKNIVIFIFNKKVTYSTYWFAPRCRCIYK